MRPWLASSLVHKPQTTNHRPHTPIDFVTGASHLRRPLRFSMPDVAHPPLSLTAAEAWSRLLDRARQDFTEQTFRTWLEPTEALRFDGATIVVGAPDQFAADWNDSKHSQLLSAYAPVALGRPVTVVFKVHEERKLRPQMDLFVAPPTGQRPAVQNG